MSAQRKIVGIDLLPGNSFEKSDLGLVLNWIKISGRTIIVLTEFAVILAFGSRFWFDKTLNDLKETVDQKQSVVRSYESVETKMRDTLAREAVVSGSLGGSARINILVEDLVVATPIDVFFENISCIGSLVAIRGRAGSELGLSGLLANLTKNPKVGQVSLSEIKYSQTDKQLSFGVSFEYTNEGGKK